jgi:uncharacterized protein YraI
MKVNAVLVNLAQKCQVIHYFYLAELLEGRGRVMRYRFNQLMCAVFVSSLAVPTFLCWGAEAASECVGKPDLSVNQAGHWHYHVDHVHRRRCWLFEPSKAAVGPAASADRMPAQNTDSQQSWISRLTMVLAKTSSKQPQQSSVQQSGISPYSSEPLQNRIVDNSSIVTTVRNDVVLRAGPGAEFSAIGHVPGGAELETTDCMGGWCQVEFNGIAGFAGAADLGNDAAIRSSSARRAENRKLTSVKHLRTNKIVSREWSQTKPPPATNGVANGERHDQLVGKSEDNEKPAPQLKDKSQETEPPQQRGSTSILIWGRPMGLDAAWQEIFVRRERSSE